VGACIDVRPGLSPGARLRRSLRKGRGGFVFVQAVNAAWRGEPALSASTFFSERGVSVVETENLYDGDVLDAIRSTKPDCIFRTGFGIIQEPVLSLAPRGVISYHHGDMRRYRGIPPGFWELHDGERAMGVTLQVIDTGLDSGKIVLERSVPILPTDSWSTLEKRAFAESVTMAFEACLLLARDDFEPRALPASELGRLYTLPNLRQWLTLQGRVVVRRARAKVDRVRRRDC